MSHRGFWHLPTNTDRLYSEGLLYFPHTPGTATFHGVEGDRKRLDRNDGRHFQE